MADKAAATPPRRVRTVVLRAGPPQGRRPLWDILTGVVGLLLVAAAVGMVVWLPEEDVLLPQYEVAIVQVQHNFTSESVDLLEGETRSVTYEIPFDNVFFVRLDVGFQDDVVASDPDEFEFVLLDQDGRVVGDRVRVENPVGRPITDPNERGWPGWNVSHYSETVSFDLGLPPQDVFVTGEREDETAEEVRERFLAEHHQPTAGMWTVRVQLLHAGDCPDPEMAEDPEEHLLRLQACRTGDDDGEDPGNAVAIEGLQYTYFDARVSQV